MAVSWTYNALTGKAIYGGRLDPLSVTAPAARPAWRNAMLANTWAVVPSTNKLSDLDPTTKTGTNPNYPGQAEYASGTNYGMLAFSGACWDEETGTLWFPLQGGHGDYGGNEPYKIKISSDSPAFSMLRPPTGWNGAVITNDNQEATGLYSDGRLRSVHSYNNNVYVTGLGPVISRTTAPWHSGQENHDFCALLNESTGESTILQDINSISQRGAGFGGACYDATRDCLWLMGTGTSSIGKFNLTTNTLTQGSNYDNHCGAWAAIVHVQEADLLLTLSKQPGLPIQPGNYPGPFLAFNPTTGARTVLSSDSAFSGAFSSGFTLSADTSPGVSWDAVNRRLLMWQNTSNTTEISTLTPGANLLTDPWAAGVLSVSGSNTVTPTTTKADGVNSRFGYSPKLGGCYLLNRTTESIYFFATE